MKKLSLVLRIIVMMVVLVSMISTICFADVFVPSTTEQVGITIGSVATLLFVGCAGILGLDLLCMLVAFLGCNTKLLATTKKTGETALYLTLVFLSFTFVGMMGSSGIGDAVIMLVSAITLISLFIRYGVKQKAYSYLALAVNLVVAILVMI